MDVEHEPVPFNRVHIRKTHPVLYRWLMVYAVGAVLTGTNLWIFTPTFLPFGISKTLVGAVFFLLGAWLFIFLNVIRNLTMVRIGQGLLVLALVGWGAGNLQQTTAGKASGALPIFVGWIAVLLLLLFMEPPVNPVTEKIESPVEPVTEQTE